MRSLQPYAKKCCSKTSDISADFIICELRKLLVAGHHLVIQHFAAPDIRACLKEVLEIRHGPADPVHNFRYFALSDSVYITLHVCHFSGFQFSVLLISHRVEIHVGILFQDKSVIFFH